MSSVGTISLGVSNPINISRPTKDMIDMKMAKSLISFLSYTSTNTKTKEDKQKCGVTVEERDINVQEAMRTGEKEERLCNIIISLLNPHKIK